MSQAQNSGSPTLAESLPRSGHGQEWAIDAYGCTTSLLRDEQAIEALIGRIIDELTLNVAAPPLLHKFGGPGGITALVLLKESHLACHTYPEHAFASFNLYCCRARPPWPWQTALAEALGAQHVTIRSFLRGAAPLP